MFIFKLADHPTRSSRKIMEIWSEGKRIAAIYPTERGIKICSELFENHLEDAVRPDRQAKYPTINVILLR